MTQIQSGQLSHGPWVWCTEAQEWEDMTPWNVSHRDTEPGGAGGCRDLKLRSQTCSFSGCIPNPHSSKHPVLSQISGPLYPQAALSSWTSFPCCPLGELLSISHWPLSSVPPPQGQPAFPAGCSIPALLPLGSDWTTCPQGKPPPIFSLHSWCLTKIHRMNERGNRKREQVTISPSGPQHRNSTLPKLRILGPDTH